MKFSDLFATCGNGCEGSSPTGISSGRTCCSKKRATHSRCAGLRSAWLSTVSPRACSAGTTSSLKTRYCSSISACASADTARTSAEVTVVRGEREASR